MIESFFRKRCLSQVVVVAMLVAGVGCGGGIGELATAVLVIKIVAAGAFAILSVAGAYWLVESARLDAAKKELILQGMRDGRPVSETITLTDEQLRTIEEKGKLKIRFSDGKEIEVDVER